MKTSFFIALFIFSSVAFAQNNYIVKTEDGRRVLLKADYTWEYIDAEAPETKSIAKESSKPVENKDCELAENFIEPELNNKIQSQLKRGRATIEDIKKKVAKDYECDVEDVILLSASEKKSNGTYHFCTNGIKVSYKRTGYSILKNRKLLPF